MNQKISDYYDLSLLCEDDIKIVCLLAQLEKLEVSQKTLSSIESLKLNDFNFDRILSLNVQTIKDLAKFFQVNVNNYKIKSDLKVVVGSDTTLMDFIGDE